MARQLKLSKLKTKALIENALDQIERETGFHIIDKVFGDTYFLFQDKKDSICHFHIKEIPGFLFAFWNTCRFDTIENQIKNSKNNGTWADAFDIDTRSELVFFTQYKRDVDKFKPGNSGFVTGIFRQAWEEQKNEDNKVTKKEEWHMHDLIEILNFMHKHPIKAYVHSGLQTRYIWDNDLSNIKCLRIYLNDWIYHYKWKLIHWYELKKQIYNSIHMAKQLKSMNVVIFDRGENWSPRINIKCRRRDKFNKEDYINDLDILDNFDDKYFNEISLDQLEYDITQPLSEEDQLRDKELRKSFRKFVKQNINKSSFDYNIIYKNIDFK